MIPEGIERITAYLSSFEVDTSLEGIFEYIGYLIYLLLCEGLIVPYSCGLELISYLLAIFLNLLSEREYRELPSLDPDNLSIFEHDKLCRNTRDSIDI
jgi:hypothetical protein